MTDKLRTPLISEMVAEALPEVRSSRIIKTRQTVNQAISMVTRAKARNLYAIQMLPAKDVASACGLTEMQVYKLATQHGWASLRRQGREKLSAPLQAREERQVEEVSRAAAMLTDEGLLGSIMRANEATQSRTKEASKDCQAFASAARSLMQVGRTLRGLDAPQAKEGDTTNVLFMSIGQLSARPRNAEPTTVAPSAPVVDVPSTLPSVAPTNPGSP